MARGINAFFDAFDRGYETTGRIMQDAELGRIGRATAEESQGFTAEDGEQLRAMANAKDANGNPYYTIEPGANGGYRVKNNFQVDGAQAADTELAPRKVTDFLGRRYDGALTESQLDGARMRAMADVIGRNDPVRGLALRNQVKESERSDVRFDREGKRFDQEQVESGLRTQGLERAERLAARDEETDIEFGKDLKGYNGSQEQIGGLAQYLNNESKALTMSLPDKNGLVSLSIAKPDGNAVFLSLPKQQQATLYAASRMLERNPKRALELIAGVNKDLAATVAAENGLTNYVAGNRNDVVAKGEQMATNRARLGMEGARLGIDRERLGLARQQLDRSFWNTEQYTDPKTGELHVYDVNRASPGKPQFVRREMPEGLKPYSPKEGGLKVNQDGSVIKDGVLYVPGAKPGEFKPAKGLGPSAVDKALEPFLKGQGAPAPVETRGVPTPAPAQRMERTTTPDGQPRFRLPGQEQWYPTEADARWAAIQRMRASPEQTEEASPYGFFTE